MMFGTGRIIGKKTALVNCFILDEKASGSRLLSKFTALYFILLHLHYLQTLINKLNT